ncbi:MAG: thioredoxin family protein [Actinobacteria bacterium]|nr:thioredoxin family protein [Actinomycetota bacterium]MCA1720527.1 thioredoxin family protein [Actinomycetota bacterium]
MVLIAVLAVTTAFGLLWRARQGRVRDSDGRIDVRRELGEQPGERATLLQFSSAFCSPCRATKRLLADVATTVPGVRHVEVDAESHLELVRRLNVLKTPTTLVLDAGGNIRQRAAGVPRKEQVLAALGSAVG